MPLLVLMVAAMLVIGAYLRLAELIQYVSRSVVVGYITGAAVLIIVNQRKELIGIVFRRKRKMASVSPLKPRATKLVFGI